MYYLHNNASDNCGLVNSKVLAPFVFLENLWPNWFYTTKYYVHARARLNGTRLDYDFQFNRGVMWVKYISSVPSNSK